LGIDGFEDIVYKIKDKSIKTKGERRKEKGKSKKLFIKSPPRNSNSQGEKIASVFYLLTFPPY
jgi:hypothetical protein